MNTARLSAAFALCLASSLALAQADANKATQPATTTTTQPAPKPAEAKLQYAEFKTSAGTFVLELNHEKAPVSVENFMKYVDKGFYDNTVFHRTIADFMIQGGGFDTDMKQKKTEAPIVNEHSNGLKNTRGTISMARTNDPNSGTSQFFINVADNDGSTRYNLDSGHGYAVFGKVIAGMEVIDDIKGRPTIKDGRENSRPQNPVVVEKARRLTADEAQKAIGETPAEKKPEAKPETKPETKPEAKPADTAKPSR